MKFTVAVLLVLIALLCFVASLFPQVPEKYTTAVGGILVAVALLAGSQ